MPQSNWPLDVQAAQMGILKPGLKSIPEKFKSVFIAYLRGCGVRSDKASTAAAVKDWDMTTSSGSGWKYKDKNSVFLPSFTTECDWFYGLFIKDEPCKRAKVVAKLWRGIFNCPFRPNLLAKLYFLTFVSTYKIPCDVVNTDDMRSVTGSIARDIFPLIGSGRVFCLDQKNAEYRVKNSDWDMLFDVRDALSVDGSVTPQSLRDFAKYPVALVFCEERPSRALDSESLAALKKRCPIYSDLELPDKDGWFLVCFDNCLPSGIYMTSVLFNFLGKIYYEYLASEYGVTITLYQCGDDKVIVFNKRVSDQFFIDMEDLTGWVIKAKPLDSLADFEFCSASIVLSPEGLQPYWRLLRSVVHLYGREKRETLFDHLVKVAGVLSYTKYHPEYDLLYQYFKVNQKFMTEEEIFILDSIAKGGEQFYFNMEVAHGWGPMTKSKKKTKSRKKNARGTKSRSPAPNSAGMLVTTGVRIPHCVRTWAQIVSNPFMVPDEWCVPFGENRRCIPDRRYVYGTAAVGANGYGFVFISGSGCVDSIPSVVSTTSTSDLNVATSISNHMGSLNVSNVDTRFSSGFNVSANQVAAGTNQIKHGLIGIRVANASSRFTMSGSVYIFQQLSGGNVGQSFTISDMMTSNRTIRRRWNEFPGRWHSIRVAGNIPEDSRFTRHCSMHEEENSAFNVLGGFIFSGTPGDLIDYEFVKYQEITFSQQHEDSAGFVMSRMPEVNDRSGVPVQKAAQESWWQSSTEFLTKASESVSQALDVVGKAGLVYRYLSNPAFSPNMALTV